MRRTPSPPTGVHLRPGRRWPTRRRPVYDDRLLGGDWQWDPADEPERQAGRRPSLIIA